MKEIFTQIRDTCPLCKQGFGIFFLPFNDIDRENSKAYKLFQVVRCLVYGVKKVRSLKQLNLYWAACGFIGENSDHKQWNTKYKVDFQCRVGAHLVNKDLVVVKPDGECVFAYLSIAMKNMEHIEACNYFNQAYGIMVDFYNATHDQKITEDELINMVKSTMQSN